MDQTRAVFQGKFDLLENIKISPLSRGYTFSDGVYEVVPFLNKTPIAFDDHIKRLKNSASALNIFPDLSKVSSEISALIDANEIVNGYVYYQISRGQDLTRNHLYESNLEPEYFGYIKNHDFHDQQFKVLLCDDIRWNRCDIKSISLLPNILMMNDAASKGCKEIIMHKEGLVTEAGASNVFFIMDENICTPKLNNNILPGITRSMTIEIFKKNGIDVLEEDFQVKHLLSASKIWLTSSTKGMAEVFDILSQEHNIKEESLLYDKCVSVFKKGFFN